MNKNNCCTIILKPTHRCNFNCSYCYDRHERSKHAEILPKEDLIMAIEKFVKMSPSLHLIWHGGEPTILGIDYLRDVMTHFKEYKGIVWSIQTNGSLLNSEWIELFREFDITIGLSWDGIFQDKTRSPLDLPKLVKVINNRVNFGVLMTVTPENSKTLIPTMKYLHNIGVGIDFNHLFGSDVTKEKYYIIAENLVNTFDFICQDPSCDIMRPFRDILNWYVGLGEGLCETSYCPGRWFSIDYNGDILPCGKPWNKDKYLFGTIYEDLTLDKLKNSTGCINLIRFKDNNLKHCRDCDKLLVCQNGCLFNSKAEDGSYNFSEAYCYYQNMLVDGVINTLEKHLENNTLVNDSIIATLNKSVSLRSKKWRNYKSPLI